MGFILDLLRQILLDVIVARVVKLFNRHKNKKKHKPS